MRVSIEKSITRIFLNYFFFNVLYNNYAYKHIIVGPP